MHTILGDGRRKYSILATVRQKSEIDNTISSEIAGGAVKINTVERTFEIDVDTFRSTPGNEEAPKVMRDEVVAFLCKDQGLGQFFRAKKTGKVRPDFEEHDVQTFTVMPDGTSLFFTDHLGRLFWSSEANEPAVRIGADLKGVHILGYEPQTESVILRKDDETTVRYCLFSERDDSPWLLYEMPLKAHEACSESVSPDGSKLYVERENVVLEIDLECGGIKERHLDTAGPWTMKKLDLLASLDERFVLLQNEGKSMEVYLYDFHQSKYYLQKGSEETPKIAEISLMGGKPRYGRYDRRFPKDSDLAA